MRSLPLPHRVSSMTSGRLHELDGIRGWAAVSVVLYHVFWETLGLKVPWFRNGFTAFALDGSLAVSIFFVLSGEALSASYFAGRGSRAVAALAIKRYPRLAMPILACCLILLVLQSLGLTFNVEAGTLVGRPDWLGSWLQTPPNVAHTIRYALVDVFTPVPSNLAVDPFLWTMRIEFLGSFTVFAALLALRFVTRRRLVLTILTAILLCGAADSRQIGCFGVGMLLADIRCAGGIEALRRRRAIAWTSILVIVSVLGLDGFARSNGHDLEAWKPIMACVLVPCIAANDTLSRFFANRVSRGLGTLSFPLYLMQFPVIVSLTSGLIVLGGPAMETPFSICVALASLAATGLAALVFMPVEALTRQVGNILLAVLFRAGPPAMRRGAAEAAPAP